MTLARVRRTILERGLIPRGARVLCACSGGPDSAALLYALAQLGPELGFGLEAASVDHGLRPDAAQDVECAGRQAAAVGVLFHGLRVQVGEGASLQAAARDARYAALLRLASERGAARVAVGHTRDDQAETVLARLLRGAGLAGLGAIDPCRADGVIRPLIDSDRAEVHALARAQFSELAEDPSNLDLRFERVRIRAHVMPALLAENPRLTEHLAALADEARDYRVPLETSALVALADASADARSVRISVLAERPLLVRHAALSAWLTRQGVVPVSRSHVAELDHALRARRGHVWLPNGFQARVDPPGDLLVLAAPDPEAKTKP
ncbi:MAG TPA: tRNA lysidine(34) synthetase TilS [Polyangiales bacterium]|nr:tRNA lysidine(34) synthetase TilS [Polyangiales bacterium]